MIAFEVPGPPIGKGRLRHRVVRSRTNPLGYASGYTPAKTKAYEDSVRWAASGAMRRKVPFDGPVALTVFAFFAIPASWSARKKTQALTGEIRPTVKPDADNALKAIADGCNGVVFRDDVQVVDAHIYKFYDANPRTLVFVRSSEKGSYHVIHREFLCSSADLPAQAATTATQQDPPRLDG